MENKLKIDTISTLEKLQQAGIRPIMVTGIALSILSTSIVFFCFFFLNLIMNLQVMQQRARHQDNLAKNIGGNSHP